LTELADKAEMLDAAKAKRFKQLQAGLDELAKEPEHDSSQRTYIQALLQRIEDVKTPEKVAELLLLRAETALSEVINAEGCTAAKLVRKPAEKSKAEKKQSSLQQLTAVLDLLQLQRDEQAASNSLDSSLFSQESAMVAELTQEVSLSNVNDTAQIKASMAYMSQEAGSVRLFRQSLGQVTMDKRVAKAIAEGPENPGPFNPEGLTIKALTQMQHLSPHYLHRFVGFVDTLLNLQQLQEQAANGKTKAVAKKK
jgi:hypothetical protein